MVTANNYRQAGQLTGVRYNEIPSLTSTGIDVVCYVVNMAQKRNFSSAQYRLVFTEAFQCQ